MPAFLTQGVSPAVCHFFIFFLLCLGLPLEARPAFAAIFLRFSGVNALARALPPLEANMRQNASSIDL